MAQVASLLHHLAFPWNEDWQLGRTRSCDSLDDLTAFVQGFESIFGFQLRITHVWLWLATHIGGFACDTRCDMIHLIHLIHDMMTRSVQPLANSLLRFNSSRFPQSAVVIDTLQTHGVNNAQAVKHGVVWGRQSGDLSKGGWGHGMAWAKDVKICEISTWEMMQCRQHYVTNLWKFVDVVFKWTESLPLNHCRGPRLWGVMARMVANPTLSWSATWCFRSRRASCRLGMWDGDDGGGDWWRLGL